MTDGSGPPIRCGIDTVEIARVDRRWPLRPICRQGGLPQTLPARDSAGADRPSGLCRGARRLRRAAYRVQPDHELIARPYTIDPAGIR
jgi:hypothetical protein